MSMPMREPEFWTANTTSAKALRKLLSPVGALYGASVRWRRATTNALRPQARVFCVGNLTAGGTGKTPVAMALGRMLEERGCKVAFLTRGYGGRLEGPVLADPAWHTAADVGDEPLLLATVARTIVASHLLVSARNGANSDEPTKAHPVRACTISSPSSSRSAARARESVATASERSSHALDTVSFRQPCATSASTVRSSGETASRTSGSLSTGPGHRASPP
jgi:hypothetical protein